MADKNDKGYGVPAAPAVPASPAKPAAPASPAGRPGKSADSDSACVREASAKERIEARRRDLARKLAATAGTGAPAAREGSPSVASRAREDTSPQVRESASRSASPASSSGAGRRPAAAPFLDEHPHPQGVSDRLRQTIAHTTSARPKDAFGKGMKKPQATARVEGKKPAASENAPKKKSCLGSIFGIIIALILLSQIGGCVASCVGDVFDSLDGEDSSWFEESGSERQGDSSDLTYSFSSDAADEAAALACARDALASLDSRERIVEHLSQGINKEYANKFGFSADDAGVDTKELALWLIDGVSCAIDDSDVFVYTDGTADVFADCTNIPVYGYVSAVDDAARSLGKRSGTPTKQQVAAATESAKEHAASGSAFIMFSLVKTDVGWTLDEDAFMEDTADHLFGL